MGGVHPFVGTVGQSVAQRRLFRRGERILVAVSGGVDSMVLLHALHSLAGAPGWKLVVAHFNHQLRGRASAADEALVRRTAQRLGCPFVAGRGDVRAQAGLEKISTEMAARTLRHEFLARVAREQKIRSIALAHHTDDQVELFFLRLLRGAGSDGLAGMKWRAPSPVDQTIYLVRPLLDQPRAELEAFAAAEKIAFRHDASNASLDFQRNCLRHELLPMLRKHYQPGLTQTTLRLMEVLGAEGELAAAQAAAWLAAKRRADFSHLPVAVQRRVVQTQLQALGVEVDFALVEALRLTADQPVTIAPGRHARRDEQGRVDIQSQASAGFEGRDESLVLGGAAGAACFGPVQLEWARSTGKKLPPRRAGCEWFDAGKVGARIRLRHWRRGDRFQPIGFPHAVKLQDWFTNQKIPRDFRHELAVATTAAGEIFWVEGQRIGERFKLDKRTVQRLKWRWRRL